MYARKQATVAQIEAYAATVRAEFVPMGFQVDANRYGVRIECCTCHESNTLNPEMWARNHKHLPAARKADFEEVTSNSDGTVNRKLYYV
jgi:hypothetical protein